MVERIAPALAWIGYGYDRLRRSFDAGKKTREAEKVEAEKTLDGEREEVQLVYNTQGKIVRPYEREQREIIKDSKGYKKHLDTFA